MTFKIKLTRWLFALLPSAGLLFGFPVISQSLFSEEVFPEILSVPTCQVQAPDSGQYQYAELHASQFKSGAATELPSMSKTWLVACDAPTTLLLQARDGQASSAPGYDSTLFGLGNVNGSGSLGHYRIRLENARVDGEKAQLYVSSNASGLEKIAAEIPLTAGLFHGWTQNTASPASGQLFSVDIRVTPTLNSLQQTNGPLVNGAELNSQAELIFSFGL